jgi:AAA family ATP:ADP antiporter
MTSALQRFTNVRKDEIFPLLASALFFFCVLSALMVVRPAREALGMESGLDTVRWLFVGTAVVTLAVNPVFGYLVAHFRRLAFISATYVFFAASLMVFWALLTFAPQAIGDVSGRVFYVWFSVFNLFSTMVFWALMADRFSLEESKRLFPMVAVGGTLGAINLILIAVGFLLLALVAAWWVAALQPRTDHAPGTEEADGQSAVDPRAVIGGSAWEGFSAVFRSRYLLAICGFVLILAVMATFLYFTRLAMVAAVAEGTDARTALFANIDMWTQIATLVTQLFIAGRLMRRIGVSLTLALLPVTVLLGFIGLALVGTITALILFEATFRAVQRGIMRPARETLFTVVSREDKYKAKAFIDTFVYRGGDVVGAWTEGLLGRLGMGLAGLAGLVVPLAVVWGLVGVWLGREQERVAGRMGMGAPAGD